MVDKSPSSSRLRTPPFHGGNRGSNPLGDAIINMTSKNSQDLVIKRLNKSIQKVIEKQILDKDPPELALAIKALQQQGNPPRKINEIISKLIVKHFQNLLDKNFSYQSYRQDLKNIAELKNYSE